MPPGITRRARARRSASIERGERFIGASRSPGPDSAASLVTSDISCIFKLLPVNSSHEESMSLVFGAIADDFTGGLELASLLVRGRVRARMLTRFAGTADIADAEAVVIGLKTRVAPKAVAVKACARAADLLASAAPRQLFFKYCATFDSTRHGNIGPCADLLAARTGADFTAFCPAFPEVKRTVFQGHLFAFDQIISESPKRLDPLTPMRDPNLVRVLQQQTQHRVGLIRHEDFKDGVDATRARIDALKRDGI